MALFISAVPISIKWPSNCRQNPGFDSCRCKSAKAIFRGNSAARLPLSLGIGGYEYFHHYGAGSEPKAPSNAPALLQKAKAAGAGLRAL
jgi:hypothetical protein